MKNQDVIPLNDNTLLLYDSMISKSQDSFILALEVINRPTIKFRTENFLFNIANAWELILKGYIIRQFGLENIYLPKQKNRTIRLSECIKVVFTDYNNPVKLNLNAINKLRNIATHLILPEYDDIYIGVYQANILYYVNFLKENFDIDVNQNLPRGFLTIATNIPNLSDVRLTERVSKEAFKQFKKEIKVVKNLDPSSTVSFEVTVKQVKKNEDLKVKIDSKSETPTQIINNWLDYGNTHPYRQSHIISVINSEFGEGTLNQYTFRIIRNFENIEKNEAFFYHHKMSNTKTYSEKCLNMIRKNIREIPNYIEICILEYKKSNPRS